MAEYKLREDVADGILLDYPDLTRRLLAYRGIERKEEAEKFLSPSYDRDVHDPMLFADMEKAIKRIYDAIDRNEKIIIYGDFDADGIPGTVVLYDFFQLIGYENVEVYIPHRHDEGFGVHLDAVDDIASRGANLIITVDCGIADIEAVKRSNELGIDVIITDHHESPNGAPDAFAVIDHKSEGCQYPEQVLCGAGVVFKLVQALLLNKDFGIAQGKEKWLLDMVALATCADMVPLVGENRALAYWGLVVLRKSRRPGIRAMCRALRINQRYMTEDDIGFMIAPRINAASRMGESMDAFRFLAARDEAIADEAYRSLHEHNETRKGVVAGLVKKIRTEIKNRNVDRSVIVVGNPEWKPSLLGLVANKLVEDFGKPVFLWGRDGKDVLKGSCRSDGSVSVVALMDKAGEIFSAYGGHDMAGGFSLVQDNIHHLEEVLSEIYIDISGTKKEDVIPLDAELPLERVNETTYREIERFAPFGVGNPKPFFEFSGVLVESVRSFGKQKNHFEIIVSDGGAKIKGIGFFMDEKSFSKKPKEGERVTVIAHIEKSMFGWKPEIRLRLIDII